MIRRHARDAASAVAIVLMVAHNHFNVRAVRDIGPDDEGWYLGSGVLLGKPGYPNGTDGWPIPEQGPLYSLWYFALSKIWRTPLDLYFASWQLLTTVLTLALYAVIRRAGAPWWQALLACFFYVNSVVADVWPFPTLFATLLILGGVIAASFARTTAMALMVVTIALAFSGFARPEMLVAWAAALVILVVRGLRETRRVRAISVLGGLAPGALLFAIFGNPFGGLRGFFAFAQHYTLNLFHYTHSPLDPWDHWGDIVMRDFPGTWTIAQAAQTNPSAFFAHVTRNVREFPKGFFAVTDSLDASRGVQIAIVSIGLFFAVVQLRRSARLSRDNVSVRALWFALDCCAFPFLFSCFVIYPRAHYFVTVGVLMAALAFTPLLRGVDVAPQPTRRVGRAALVVALCALVVVLTGSKGGAASLGEWLTQRPANRALFGDRQRTIAYLQGLKLEGPVVALEESWGSCFYAGYTCTSHLRYEKEEPFDGFIHKFGINLLFIDEKMLRHPKFVDDREFADFLENPEKHGFILKTVPGTRMRIAYRPALKPELGDPRGR